MKDITLPTTTGSAFDEALQANKRGWSIVPANPQSKSPIVNWKVYQDRRASKSEIKGWSNSEAFALVTGYLSGVIVLDVDPGGQKALKGKHLPTTPIASTPRRGYHYYFKHLGKKVITAAHILGDQSAVDIRGDGGVVILPGVTDREWIISPDDAPMAAMPEWLEEITCKDQEHTKHSNIYVTRFTLPSDSPDVITFNGKRIGREELWSYASRTDIGILTANYLGLPTEGLEEKGKTKPFRCVLPGHKDKKPSASLFKHPKTGAVLYRDWHSASGERWFSMADVRASMSYGDTKRFNPPELATWQIRLLVEIEKMKPLEVEALPLPSDAKPSTKKVYDGFRLLLGCKWRYSPYQSTPFSRKFAAAWCGVSESTAQQAITSLHMEFKVIRIVGQHGYLRLWLPTKKEE